MTGTSVAHYLLEEKLLDSPTGPLYKARDTRHDHTVALKILPAGLGEDAAARQSFIEVVRAAGSLGNPAIPAVHDGGESPDGRLFVAMEFTGGETLRSKLASGPLPLPQAISLATQIARALAAAQQRGIMHRDIQPGTVLVDEAGTAKLLDFGVSRLVGAAAQTRTAELSGDQTYLAPELLQGQEIDTRADIWSVGALLSESVGGKRGKVPEELRWVVDRCMRKDPRERYGSAAELADDLEAVAAGLEKGTLKSVKLHAAPRQPRRWAVAGAIAGAAVVIAAVLVVTLWWKPWLPRTTERVTIVLLPVVPESLSDDDMLDEMLTDGLSTDLTKIRQFRVISQSSARTIEPEEPISEVARKLNVDYVLEATIGRDGERVKFSLNLWQVKPEQLAWRKDYVAPGEALDALESTAAEEVARRLGVQVTTEDRNRLAIRPAVKQEAYELYLKASVMDFWDEENSKQMIEYLERAIEIDPTFLLAYTTIRDPLLIRGTAEERARAEEMLQRARELDPDHPRVILAEITTGSMDSQTVAELKQLAERYPADMDVLMTYSSCSGYLGDYEASITAAREALRLDPIYFWNHHMYSWICLNYRKWDEGVAAFERFIELYPDNTLPHGNYAILLQGMGRFEDALREAITSRQIAGIDQTADWCIGCIKACLGDEAGARAIAANSERRWEREKRMWNTATSSDSVGLVMLYCCLGDYDTALHWLRVSVEFGATGEINWSLYYFDPLREIPEAVELARKSGWPEWTLNRIEPVWYPPADPRRR